MAVDVFVGVNSLLAGFIVLVVSVVVVVAFVAAVPVVDSELVVMPELNVRILALGRIRWLSSLVSSSTFSPDVLRDGPSSPEVSSRFFGC